MAGRERGQSDAPSAANARTIPHAASTTQAADFLCSEAVTGGPVRAGIPQSTSRGSIRRTRRPSGSAGGAESTARGLSVFDETDLRFVDELAESGIGENDLVVARHGDGHFSRWLSGLRASVFACRLDGDGVLGLVGELD